MFFENDSFTFAQLIVCRVGGPRRQAQLDPTLARCERLLLTAHNADLTVDYWALAFATWRANLDAFIASEPMPTIIDKSAGY